MSVELTTQADCAVLTLNRPEALNALSSAMLRDIGEAFDEVAKAKARALIITGAGNKAFCAGADIKEFRNQAMLDSKARTELGQATFAKLDTLPIASIAVINGYAFGGGLELAMACTFRLAARHAKLGQPEIKLGTIPGYGGTQRLPRLVGEARALELILTGRTLDAAEAERIGLVSRIVDGDAIAAGINFAHAVHLLQPANPGFRARRRAARPRPADQRRVKIGGRSFHPVVPDQGCRRRRSRLRTEA